MTRRTRFLGNLLDIAGDAGLSQAAESCRDERNSGLLVGTSGRIEERSALPETNMALDSEIVDYGGCFLLPGFVDCHVHFPQVYSQGCFGSHALLDWLEQHIFRAEAELSNVAFAEQAALDFVTALAASGTTTSCIFGSQFRHAEEALVAALQTRGLRAILGRTLMTQGPPAAQPLCTSLDEGLALAREEILNWHPSVASDRGALLRIALVPRFALSFEPNELRKVAAFWGEVSELGVHFTTHLAEHGGGDHSEVGLVQKTFGVERYLDVYDHHFLSGSNSRGLSFLSRRSLFAHAVHLSDTERQRLSETESAIAHCPTSQLFLGNPAMNWRQTRAHKIKVGLGTDIGAGTTWSIPEVALSAYMVHWLADRSSLTPPELLHLATLSGAHALDLNDRIGNFDLGKDADFVVIDPKSSPLLERRLEMIEQGDPKQRTNQTLFALFHHLKHTGLKAAYVRGRRVFP